MKFSVAALTGLFSSTAVALPCSLAWNYASCATALLPDNASGLATTQTGSIQTGSSTLTLSGAWDIQAGQGVWIPHAGQNATTAAPAITGITVQAVIGSSTVPYQIVARDAAGGLSPASPIVNAVNSAAPNALRYNRNPAISNTNTVTWTTDANAVDVLIYRNGVLVALVPASEDSFLDEGQFGLNSPDFPASPPLVASPAPLISIALAVSGTVVTLSKAALNGVTSAAIQHDDGAALQTWLTSGCGFDAFMLLPIGNYNTHQQLSCTGTNGTSSFIQGQGGMQRIGLRSGSFISYWGRGDQAVLYTAGLNGSTFQDFLLYGNYIAKWALQNDSISGNAASGDHFNRIGFWRTNASADSDAIAFGHVGCTGQLSEQFFDSPFVFNDVGGHAGFHSHCGGNTKNVHFSNYQIVGYHIGATGVTTTGNWSFINGVIGNVSDALFDNISTLNVDGLEAEGVQNSRLTRIVAPAAQAFQRFNAVQFATPAPSDGFFVGEVSNSTVEISNSFFGAGTYQGEYRWNVPGLYGDPGVLIKSTNVYYENSTCVPYYVGGNYVGAIGAYPNDNGRLIEPVNFISEGDYGSTKINGSPVQVRFQQKNFAAGDQITNHVFARKNITNSLAPATSFLDVYGGGAWLHAWPDPAAPTVTVNTVGAATCSYKVAFRDASGKRSTNLSPAASVTNCAMPPNNTISVSPVPPGAWFMDVYDATAGMLVGIVNASQFPYVGWSLADTGQSRSAYAVPLRNSTGDMTIDGALTIGSGATCNGPPTPQFSVKSGIIVQC